MLKNFVNQWKIPRMLIRNCSPAVVSSSLCKVFSRPMSDGDPRMVTLASEVQFHLMSLVSKQGDSLLEIVNIMDDNGPSFRCTGMYDEAVNLVTMVDSTEFPTKSVSFKITLKAASYYLSLYDENVVATVPLKDDVTDRERFFHLIHGNYSMFESKKHRDFFLGSNKDGSLQLINVHDKCFPDQRTLFLMHSKLMPLRQLLACVASVSVGLRSKKDRAKLPSLFAPEPHGDACYAGQATVYILSI